jgi:flagellar biosynthetic protein FliR
MTAIGPDTILAVFVLFCRIGGCLMLMPGFSSTRVPMQIRLFLAVAVTLALTPVLMPRLSVLPQNPPATTLMVLFFSETMLGALIGAIGRLFFAALQFMATAAAMFVGFGAMPGTAVEDAEPVPPLASMITLTATVLIFVTDQHWEVFRGLVASYTALPVSEPFLADFSLTRLADAFSSTFILALQISSPFVVYALFVNFLVGIANKLTPQIPVYFISLPFVLAGGLILLYFTIGEALRLFMDGFVGWLQGG